MTEDPRVERTREVLFAAVRDLTRAEGIHAVTSQRLSADTGISRSTIHRHWPEIRDLVIGALEHPQPVLETPLLGDLRVDLAVDLHGFRLQLEDHDTLAVLVGLLSEALFDGDFADVLRAHADVHFGRLRRVLAAGQATGELRPDIDVDAAAALLAGPLLFRRAVLGTPVDHAFVEQVVDGFVAAHAPHRTDRPSAPQEH